MNKKQTIKEIRRDMEASGFPRACKQAITEVKADLRDICSRLAKEQGMDMIRDMSSRIKSADSIYAKLRRKCLSTDFATAEERFNDLAGIRIVCLFLDDIFSIAGAIRAMGKYRIVKEKDFISKPKRNGYRSLHIIVAVPVKVDRKEKEIRLEIQIRTMAMDYWSVIEYQLLYKKNQNGKGMAKKRLRKYSDEIAGLDLQMVKLRKEIFETNAEEGYSPKGNIQSSQESSQEPLTALSR